MTVPAPADPTRVPPHEGRVDPRRVRSRAAALHAAGELLVEGGLGAVTVEAITARSGVAKTTIYRHWPTRRDLVQAAFWHLAPPPPDLDHDLPLHERLAVQLLHEARVFMGNPLLPALIEAVLRDPEMAGFRDEFVGIQLSRLREVLAEARATRALHPDVQDEEVLEMALGALMTRTGLLRRDIDLDAARRIAALALTLGVR
jgi:AcrR family transcriptional regulator